MVEIIVHGTFCGILGYLIGDVLTFRGEILGFARPLFFKVFGVNDEFELNSLSYFFYKISIGCSKCIGGQLALWSTPFLVGELNWWWYSYGVTTAIFIPVLISKLQN